MKGSIINFELGFKEKPVDIDQVLTQLGFFELTEDQPPGLREYWLFEQRSGMGVRFIYGEKTLGRYWSRLVPHINIVSQASIVTIDKGGLESKFDLEKQISVAKILRDHFDGVLYDAQKDEIITD